MESLKGKTAVVTGSAKGIGAGIVRLFAARGVHTVINYRKSDKAAIKLQDEISLNGGSSVVIQADVKMPDEAQKLIDAAIQTFGRIDILVNNAGDFLYKNIDDLSAHEWQNILESNLYSTFFCTRAAIKDMKKRNWGRIINIGDMRAERITAQPMKTPYIIAKSGVLQLTRSFAVDTAEHGITVNTVSPGYIDSGNYSDSFKQRILEKIPAGRFGLPEDIAETVVFLASEKSGYITGANIVVAGGADI